MTLCKLLARLPEFQAKAGFDVKEKDIIGVDNVAKLILRDVSVQYTLNYLARVAEMNECYLKQLFKLMYSITIH